MRGGLELTDIPEGFLIPVVATLGVVGNLGKVQTQFEFFLDLLSNRVIFALE